MSCKAMIWAASVKTGSSRAKAVLLALANLHNDAKGCAWPTVATLADATEMSPRSVQYAIKELEAGGLLTVKRFKAFTNCRNTPANTYRLNIAAAVDTDSAPPRAKVADNTVIQPSIIYLDSAPARAKIAEEKEKGGLEGFSEFWNTFPKQVAIGAAISAYQDAIRYIRPPDLLKATFAYRQWTEFEMKDDEFICSPANWLNQKRFLDWHETRVAS